MRNLLIAFSIIFTIVSCNQNLKIENNNSLKDSLIGDWESIIELDSNQVFIDISPPEGFSFKKDSMEFFFGLLDIKRDTSKGTKIVKYLGNFREYKLEENILFTKNIEHKKWQELWNIKQIRNDTLFLTDKEGQYGKLKRLKSKDSYKDFDKIIYSSTGCYGTCPILNISLDRNGNVLFYGEAHIKFIGFYQGKIDQKYTAFVFKKFERANIISLEKEYSDAITDMQTITTTFVKDGKIIKSVYDYARQAPKELVWAYVPISFIYDSHKLLKVSDSNEFPKIKLIDFSIGEKKLQLLESEGFFLWTELWKSNVTEVKFNEIYNLSFQKETNQLKLKSITSDGRYFKFKYKEKATIYDLGYNFIEKNFKKTDFKKVEEYISPDL